MRREPATVVSALADTLRSDRGRPFVTMYDGASDERVELSVGTFDNWVCKLANLFSAEWELDPGDLVGIAMPPHWQSMVAALGAWTAGLTIALESETAVSATLVGPAWQGDPKRAGQILASSLRPLGLGFTTRPPAGWLDWAVEVPPQPDMLLDPRAPGGEDPALVTPSGSASHARLLERGLAGARAVGLEPGGRLLTDLNPADPVGIDQALLAPLATGSSVVLLVNCPAERREPIAAQEHVTCRAWHSTIHAGLPQG